MHKLAEIENIEELRRRQGIDDHELREEIGRLGVGDIVKITFLSGNIPPSAETLSVRVTSIRGLAFRGKLASKPDSVGLSRLRIGAPVAFHAADIHSIPKGQQHGSAGGD
jgi:hypothetical protein